MPKTYMSGEARKILEEDFKKDEYIGDRMSELVEKTGLKEGQIGAWFGRARRKRKTAEEETQRAQNRNTIADLREQLEASRAENESLRAENERLRAENAALKREPGLARDSVGMIDDFEDLPNWADLPNDGGATPGEEI